VLGAVHRHVGVAEQVPDRRPLIGDGHAQGGGDEHLLAMEHEGCAEGLDEPLGEDLDLAQRGTLTHDDELVATDTGHRVGVAHRLQEPARSLDEDVVPG
jgi:hypothetical protein